MSNRTKILRNKKLRSAQLPDLSGYPGPGAVNAYICQTCRQSTVTVHVDHGVTPMFLACRVTPGCEGKAVSSMYAPCKLVPAWEWYRPTPAEMRALVPASRDHVTQGGLLLRAAAGSVAS